MEVRIKGNPDFVRACLYKNDILLQMESSDYITESWKPFMPVAELKNITGMVKKTKSGIIVMRN